MKDDAFVIVGVIDNMPNFVGVSEEYPDIFIPFSVFPAADTLVVSTALPAESLLNPIRQSIYSIDKDQPIVDAATLRQMLDMYGYAGPRFALALFGAFAVAALVLCFVCIYGVLSFVTSQRSHEIGIRMALGANRANVMWMVLRHALLLASIVPGDMNEFAASEASGRQSQGVSQRLHRIAGRWLPARRAAATDPIHALRSE